MGESTVVTERETEVIEKRPSLDDAVFQEAVVVNEAEATATAAVDADGMESVVAVMPSEADVREGALATANGAAGVREITSDAPEALRNGEIGDDAVAADDEQRPAPTPKPIQAGLRPGLRAGLPR